MVDVPFQHDLPAVPALNLPNRCWRGAVELVLGYTVVLEELPNLSNVLFRRAFRACAKDPHQFGEGRIAHLAAEGDLLAEEAPVVVFLGRLDGKMGRIVALDDHPPWPVSPPGPSCHLGEELESAFRGPDIREVKA